jgi:hypothetical protein
MEYRKAMQILREWRLYAPALVLHGGVWHVISRASVQSSGPTIEDALDAGGFLPPRENNHSPPLFVAVGLNIIQGDNGIASARSKTMAQRIANALNEYIPGDRGF